MSLPVLTYIINAQWWWLEEEDDDDNTLESCSTRELHPVGVMLCVTVCAKECERAMSRASCRLLVRIFIGSVCLCLCVWSRLYCVERKMKICWARIPFAAGRCFDEWRCRVERGLICFGWLCLFLLFFSGELSRHPSRRRFVRLLHLGVEYTINTNSSRVTMRTQSRFFCVSKSVI